MPSKLKKSNTVPNREAASKPEKPARKKDKRSINTEANIKNTLLIALGQKRFSDITISDICRVSGITRATFYQHYGSLADVLDQLLDDFIAELGDVPMEICESCAGINASPVEERIWKGIPFCHFYASQNPYRALLNDETIAERLIEQIVDKSLDETATALQKRMPGIDIDRTQLRFFNIFRINGCLAAVKAAQRGGYDWSFIQPTLDSAIASAFEAL